MNRVIFCFTIMVSVFLFAPSTVVGDWCEFMCISDYLNLTCSEYEIVLAPGVQVVNGYYCSIASGNVLSTWCFVPGCTEEVYCDGFRALSDCGWDTSTSAFISAGAEYCHDMWVEADVSVNTSPPTQAYPGHIRAKTQICYGDYAHHWKLLNWIAVATSDVIYDVALTGETSRSDAWTATGTVEVIDIVDPNDEGRLRRRGSLLMAPTMQTEDMSCLLAAGTHRDAIGLEYDPNTYSWIGQPVLSGGLDELDLRSRNFYFTDMEMDVDRNCRFNEFDVSVLAMSIGTPIPPFDPTCPDPNAPGCPRDPNNLWLWDFNSSGDIDQDDVDFLQIFVDHNLDSGVLGDLDGDGDTDCNDWEAMQPFPITYLGQGDYRVELDADLNGETDESDLAEILAMFVDANANGIPDECVCADTGQTPGDTNGDGSINSLDIDPFVDAVVDAEQYNIDHAPLMWQCTADINCDGSMNSLDIDPFVDCLTGGCPPCP